MSPLGYTVYHGPSQLDGEPIIALVSLTTTNDKTGPMLQTWIMPAELPPSVAIAQGADDSVCGECRHRHSLGGACYVSPYRGPDRIWRAWQNGRYPALDARYRRRLAGRPLRLGAYGDPAAVPWAVWQPLVEGAGRITGYTHQAHRLDDLALLDHCMVSVDTEAEALFYQSKGARTYRVKLPDEPLLKGEIACPYPTQGLQCIDCGICHGAYQHGASVVIDVHGAKAKKFTRINAVNVA